MSDEALCTSCEQIGFDRHGCACGEWLCECCYDGTHQNHDALDIEEFILRAEALDAARKGI